MSADLFNDHCLLVIGYRAPNRSYSPSVGRWINQDPAGYIAGANTYQFVESNPTGNVDPRETRDCDEFPEQVRIDTAQFGKLLLEITVGSFYWLPPWVQVPVFFPSRR